MTIRPTSLFLGSALACLSLPANAQMGPRQDAANVVYRWERTVSPDGLIEERTPVTDLLDWLDSGAVTIDLETLVDSTGRHYGMVADAHQEEEDGDVHYSVELVQTQGRQLTRAEIEQSWRDANPLAGPEELRAFLDRRRNRDAQPDPSEPVERISPRLQEWMHQAHPGDSLRVTVRLKDDRALVRLPRLAPSLFSVEPAFALDQMERRLRAIETRKNRLEDTQAPVLAELAAYGGRMIDPHWIINGFDAELTWNALVALAGNPAVERIERIEQPTPDSGANDLEDMRWAGQVYQYHDAGFMGETPSGKSSYNDICIAILDTNIDADHPAWDDWNGGPSRLQSIWRYSFWSGWQQVTTSWTVGMSHGTKVAGVCVGDLMDGQDPAITSVADQEARTGFAPEASFIFIEASKVPIEGVGKGVGFVKMIERAVELNVDVINMSMGAVGCNRKASANDAVDAAMLDGIFFAQSGGNNAHGGSSCNVSNPGAASGAFTVNQLDRTAVPLKGSLIGSQASRGGDSLGRAVVAIASYAGPDAPTAAAKGDSYGVFGMSSAAAPAVAGSAACLKEHLLAVFSSAVANNVGFMYASMLVFGDGQMEDGTKASTFAPMDELYGAGRMHVRMFNAAGMDTPWRVRLFSRVIDDGEVAIDMFANPDSMGVNQPLPSDVERLRIAAFWHEPNIEHGPKKTAQIQLSLWGPMTFLSGTADDPRQRIYLDTKAGGSTWTIGLTGVDVPKSKDSNYFHKQTKRNVYVAMYWEDMDRDDADGPAADID